MRWHLVTCLLLVITPSVATFSVALARSTYRHQQQRQRVRQQRGPRWKVEIRSIASIDFSRQSPVRFQSEVDLPIDDPTNRVVRYRCRVAYDGAGFSGFQLQNGGATGSREGRTTTIKRTVQGVMEQVLHQRFGRLIRVVGAGRTDTGVHARGQAVHFDLSVLEHGTFKEDPERLESALNKMLPSDIRVWSVGPAPAPCIEQVNSGTKVYAWNVMRKSTSKLYSYRICLADAMDPLIRHDRWQLDSNWVRDATNDKMDLNFLGQILRHYEGTHDFVCFAGALEANARKTGVKMTTVRTIHCCELVCEEENSQLYRIDVYLDGALYKMVRNIVGTAIDVWRKAMSYEDFERLLDEPTAYGLTRDDNPCKPAPSHGLTLERVFYQDDDF